MNIKCVLELLVGAREAGIRFAFKEEVKVRVAGSRLDGMMCPVNAAALQFDGKCGWSEAASAGADARAMGLRTSDYLRLVYAADYPAEARTLPKVRNLRRMLLRACGLEEAKP